MEDEAAVIPLYMGMPGEEKQGLNKTCSYYWCVNKFASEDDKEAAEQFLYWLVTSKTGIQIMTRIWGFRFLIGRRRFRKIHSSRRCMRRKKQGISPLVNIISMESIQHGQII